VSARRVYNDLGVVEFRSGASVRCPTDTYRARTEPDQETQTRETSLRSDHHPPIEVFTMPEMGVHDERNAHFT